MGPLISIIVPVYNKEEYINECIKSILKQTYNNFEVLLIDDGSTDNSKEVIQSFFYDKRIKYYFQENKGVSKTRNLGIEKITGDYLVFLDADDTLSRFFLEKMLYKANESTVVCCGHKKINLKKGTMFSSNAVTKNDILLNFILNKVDINTNSWLIPTNLLRNKEIYFDEDLSWGEDMLFFIKVLVSAKESKYINETLTNYYIEVSNSLSSFKQKKIEQDIVWVERAVEFLVKNNKDKIYINALQNYRLPSLVIYGLFHLKKVVPKNDYLVYKSKYKKYIKNLKLNNGLRSVKAWLYKLQI